MKRKIFALPLALAFLFLISCAPSGAENDDTTQQPEPPNALESEPSDPLETQTDPVDISDTVHFDSQLGCSADYDPLFFTAEDYEDEYYKCIVGFYMSSIWEKNGFEIWVGVNPLDASSVEEAVDYLCQEMNVDRTHDNEVIREDVTFGSGHYTATHLTYQQCGYAVGNVYVTKQNGTVFEVTLSSYYNPPEKELALAYAILDSITF